MNEKEYREQVVRLEYQKTTDGTVYVSVNGTKI